MHVNGDDAEAVVYATPPLLQCIIVTFGQVRVRDRRRVSTEIRQEHFD